MGYFEEFVEGKSSDNELNKGIFKQNQKSNIVDPYYFDCDNNHGKL